MWLWKIFFPVTICLFGCNHGSEFIVPPNDGKMRYFRGFETDEFHFKIKNDATNAKNVSYIYLLDNLDARTNYGRYIRISVRYDLHGTTWLNIYSSNSGLTASERTAKFRDKPDKEGYRGYWIRRQRHLFNGRLNRWEFGHEWDSVHPIMRLELKFAFFPQFFALEGFSTWKLEQILFRRPSSSFGFFSSADLSMVHMPTFFPPMEKMVASQTDSPDLASRGSSAGLNLEFFGREIFNSSPQTTKTIKFALDDLKAKNPQTAKKSSMDKSPVSKNSSTHQKEATSTSLKLTLADLKECDRNYTKKTRFETPMTKASKSNNFAIEKDLLNDTFPRVANPSITLPSISIPKITVPNVTFPKINIPPVTLPKVNLPKITVPQVTFPKINIPPVTLPSIKLPKITLPIVTFPKIKFPSVPWPNVNLLKATLPNTISKMSVRSVLTSDELPKIPFPNVTQLKMNISFFTEPSVELPKLTLPSVTFPKIDIPSVTWPSIEIPKITLPNVTFPKIEIPSINLPNVTVSKVTWSEIPYPNVTFSEGQIPIMTLLPMFQSNVTPPYAN